MTVHAGPTIALAVLAGLFLLGAAAMAWRGHGQRRTAARVAARAVSAPAEVVELNAKDVSVGGEPTTLYYPTVRFTPEGGEPVEAECLTGVEPPPPHAGDPVEVRYDPRRPAHVELAGTDPTASAGRSSFLVARLLVMVALALPLGWLLLALLIWE